MSRVFVDNLDFLQELLISYGGFSASNFDKLFEDLLLAVVCKWLVLLLVQVPSQKLEHSFMSIHNPSTSTIFVKLAICKMAISKNMLPTNQTLVRLIISSVRVESSEMTFELNWTKNRKRSEKPLFSVKHMALPLNCYTKNYSRISARHIYKGFMIDLLSRELARYLVR